MLPAVLTAGCVARPQPQGVPIGTYSGPTAGTTSAAARYGADAAALAATIPGCQSAKDLSSSQVRGVAQGPLTTAARSASSATECSLRGRTALLLTFTDQSSQDSAAKQVAAAERFYASGPGWLAAAVQPTDAPSDQSLVDAVAGALGGSSRRGDLALSEGPPGSG